MVFKNNAEIGKVKLNLSNLFAIQVDKHQWKHKGRIIKNQHR
jgi:hypothetical protein